MAKESESMHPDKDETDVTPEEQTDFVWEEPTTTPDFIACAYNAIQAMDGLDASMLGKWAEDAKKRIIRKSVKIIDRCIDDLYDELIVLNEKENEDEE